MRGVEPNSVAAVFRGVRRLWWKWQLQLVAVVVEAVVAAVLLL